MSALREKAVVPDTALRRVAAIVAAIQRRLAEKDGDRR